MGYTAWKEENWDRQTSGGPSDWDHIFGVRDFAYLRDDNLSIVNRRKGWGGCQAYTHPNNSFPNNSENLSKSESGSSATLNSNSFFANTNAPSPQGLNTQVQATDITDPKVDEPEYEEDQPGLPIQP